jgi:L-ascorbate metabolism protein UlaG (beta-lactamase superfamily)
MTIVVLIIIMVVTIIFGYMQLPIFGSSSKDERKNLIEHSPNYKNGQFQNQRTTPAITEGESYFSVIKYWLFEKGENLIPSNKIPSSKTKLAELDPMEDVLIWFGHSSYYIQLNGLKILVDPVFSGSASPMPSGVEAFDGTDIYNTDEIPEIDYLFISHDHYDHTDYKTLSQLQTKVKKVICGLGVGAHLERWTYSSDQLIETDWYAETTLNETIKATSYPARHFSGRGFFRNKSLWQSYLIESDSFKIYIGGDSGYDKHFKEIGDKHGPIDLAILENGQYDKKWAYIHMMPDECVKAAIDLGAKRIFPVHSCKFALGNHSWKEPLTRLVEENKEANIPLVTPLIGEKVRLRDSTQVFGSWWEAIK